ncbi:MAG: hypothetical protein YYHSYBAR_000932 [Candidatus Fervidibacter sacchari]
MRPPEVNCEGKFFVFLRDPQYPFAKPERKVVAMDNKSGNFLTSGCLKGGSVFGTADEN